MKPWDKPQRFWKWNSVSALSFRSVLVANSKQKFLFPSCCCKSFLGIVFKITHLVCLRMSWEKQGDYKCICHGHCTTFQFCLKYSFGCGELPLHLGPVHWHVWVRKCQLLLKLTYWETWRIYASLLILWIILRRFSPVEKENSRFILIFLKYYFDFWGALKGTPLFNRWVLQKGV